MRGACWLTLEHVACPCAQDVDENSIWADLSKSGGKRRGRARGESSGEATPVLSIDDSEFEQLFVKVNESQSSKKKKKKKKVGPARHARGGAEGVCTRAHG